MKSALLASVSLVALAAGALALLGRRAAPHARREPTPAVVKAAAMPVPRTAEITRNFLLYFIVPIWTCAGVADWLCHRATHIETTSGAKETLIHLVMLAEMAVPVLAGLFLEITSPVLAMMIAAFFVHEATALLDVSFAWTRREVSPLEQHVHSFLEMVPLMAVSFITVLHWREFLAIFGLGPETPDMSIRRKDEPLSTGYTSAVLTSLTLLEALPYLEELWRDLRASGFRLTPPHPPNASRWVPPSPTSGRGAS